MRHLKTRKRIAVHEGWSCVLIQRIYRGHLGRKAANRWINTKADITALHALSTACAIAISRIWRGYIARKRAAHFKRQMTEYILRIREADEEFDERDLVVDNGGFLSRFIPRAVNRQ